MVALDPRRRVGERGARLLGDLPVGPPVGVGQAETRRVAPVAIEAGGVLEDRGVAPRPHRGQDLFDLPRDLGRHGVRVAHERPHHRRHPGRPRVEPADHALTRFFISSTSPLTAE